MRVEVVSYYSAVHGALLVEWRRVILHRGGSANGRLLVTLRFGMVQLLVFLLAVEGLLAATVPIRFVQQHGDLMQENSSTNGNIAGDSVSTSQTSTTNEMSTAGPTSQMSTAESTTVPTSESSSEISTEESHTTTERSTTVPTSPASTGESTAETTSLLTEQSTTERTYQTSCPQPTTEPTSHTPSEKATAEQTPQTPTEESTKSAIHTTGTSQSSTGTSWQSFDYIPWAIAAGIFVCGLLIVGIIWVCIRQKKKKKEKSAGHTNDSGSGQTDTRGPNAWVSINAGLWAQKTITDFKGTEVPGEESPAATDQVPPKMTKQSAKSPVKTKPLEHTSTSLMSIKRVSQRSTSIVRPIGKQEPEPKSLSKKSVAIGKQEDAKSAMSTCRLKRAVKYEEIKSAKSMSVASIGKHEKDASSPKHTSVSMVASHQEKVTTPSASPTAATTQEKHGKVSGDHIHRSKSVTATVSASPGLEAT